MKIIVQKMESGKWVTVESYPTKAEFVEAIKFKTALYHGAWQEAGEEKLTDFENALSKVLDNEKFRRIVCGSREYYYKNGRKYMTDKDIPLLGGYIKKRVNGLIEN